jgi:hypothetical protein
MIAESEKTFAVQKLADERLHLLGQVCDHGRGGAPRSLL